MTTNLLDVMDGMRKIAMTSTTPKVPQQQPPQQPPQTGADWGSTLKPPAMGPAGAATQGPDLQAQQAARAKMQQGWSPAATGEAERKRLARGMGRVRPGETGVFESVGRRFRGAYNWARHMGTERGSRGWTDIWSPQIDAIGRLDDPSIAGEMSTWAPFFLRSNRKIIPLGGLDRMAANTRLGRELTAQGVKPGGVKLGRGLFTGGLLAEGALPHVAARHTAAGRAGQAIAPFHADYQNMDQPTKDAWDQYALWLRQERAKTVEPQYLDQTVAEDLASVYSVQKQREGGAAHGPKTLPERIPGTPASQKPRVGKGTWEQYWAGESPVRPEDIGIRATDVIPATTAAPMRYIDPATGEIDQSRMVHDRYAMMQEAWLTPGGDSGVVPEDFGALERTIKTHLDQQVGPAPKDPNQLAEWKANRKEIRDSLNAWAVNNLEAGNPPREIAMHLDPDRATADLSHREGETLKDIRSTEGLMEFINQEDPLIDPAQAQALQESIGEYDPDVHTTPGLEDVESVIPQERQHELRPEQQQIVANMPDWAKQRMVQSGMDLGEAADYWMQNYAGLDAQAAMQQAGGFSEQDIAQASEATEWHAYLNEKQRAGVRTFTPEMYDAYANLTPQRRYEMLNLKLRPAELRTFRSLPDWAKINMMQSDMPVAQAMQYWKQQYAGLAPEAQRTQAGYTGNAVAGGSRPSEDPWSSEGKEAMDLMTQIKKGNAAMAVNTAPMVPGAPPNRPLVHDPTAVNPTPPPVTEPVGPGVERAAAKPLPRTLQQQDQVELAKRQLPGGAPAGAPGASGGVQIAKPTQGTGGTPGQIAGVTQGAAEGTAQQAPQLTNPDPYADPFMPGGAPAVPNVGQVTAQGGTPAPTAGATQGVAEADPNDMFAAMAKQRDVEPQPLADVDTATGATETPVPGGAGGDITQLPGMAGMPGVQDIEGWLAMGTEAETARGNIEQAMANGQQPEPSDLIAYMGHNAAKTHEGEPAKVQALMRQIYSDNVVDLNDLQAIAPKVGKHVFNIPDELLPEANENAGFLQQAMNWFEDASTLERMAVMIGVPVAILGAANIMFGEGGMGSMLAMGAGLGAAGYGSGMLNPLIDMIPGATKWVNKPKPMVEGGLMGLLGLDGQAQGEGGAPGMAGLDAPDAADAPPDARSGYSQQLEDVITAIESMPPGDARNKLIRKAYEEAGAYANIPGMGWFMPNLGKLKEYHSQLPQQ